MRIARKCNCSAKHYARGYCKKCYQRLVYRGILKPKPQPKGIKAGKKIKERLYAAIEYSNGRTCADIGRELGISRQRVWVYIKTRNDLAEIRKKHKRIRRTLQKKKVALKVLNRVSP